MSKMYLAYSHSTIKDWRVYATPPKAPANYKDILKIDEFVKGKWVEMENDARDAVLTGKLDAIKYNVSISDAPITVPPGKILDLSTQFMRCYCLKPSVFLRLAVLESVMVNGMLPQASQWAIKSETTGKPVMLEDLAQFSGMDPILHSGGMGLPANGTYPAFIDPVRALLGTSAYDADDLPRIAKRFELTVPTNIDTQLAFVRGLAKLLGEA